MTTLSPIKHEEQYLEYLRELTAFCDSGHTPTAEETVRMEHLAILLEVYERETENIAPQDAITAIRLRMHERELSPSDVAPYFGSRSRVSEVLNGKRKLSLEMIRRLSVALDIPIEFLVEAEGVSSANHTGEPDWSAFPISEMYNRGWIEAKTKRSKNLSESMKNFFNAADQELFAAAYKKSVTVRSGDLLSENARIAWLTRVISIAKSAVDLVPKFNIKKLNEEFFEEIARCSQFTDGHTKAIKKISKVGIVVIYEPSLKNAFVDGAATQYRGTPIIAFTLRHDRIDSFWFTLLHELCHVARHLDHGKYFIDDFDREERESKIEAEANRVARDSLVPRTEWRRCEASKNPTVENILSVARQLGRDPAIVAGRVRWDKKNYTIFTELVGFGLLRKQFRKGIQL